MDIENTNIIRWLETLENAKAGSKSPKKLSYLMKLASKPKRIRASINLDKINKLTSENDSIIVPGKVLGGGSISKKISITAIDFTDSALLKLKSSKCSVVSLDDAIKDKNARIII
jgi:large subunit ribosomal protein L18e